MTVKNLTKNTIVARESKVARSFWDRFLGLLHPNNPRALVFYTRFGIHTFGLKQPIDVLVLGTDNCVVKLKEKLPANSFFFWNPGYSKVVELPENSIAKSKTKVGDRLELTN